MVYRVQAAHSDFDSILANHQKTDIPGGDGQFLVGPRILDDWTPPTLIYCRGKRRIRPNLMDYDQGRAFAIDDETIDKLALREADWCRLVHVEVDALDLRFNPFGPIQFTLLAITRLVDAVDRSRTTFKPFGDELLQDNLPDETFFQKESLPTTGLFHHKSGASTWLLTYDDESLPEQSFKRAFESAQLTGLKFIPIGNT